MIPPFRAF
jgi:hypothetical protein